VIGWRRQQGQPEKGGEKLPSTQALGSLCSVQFTESRQPEFISASQITGGPR